MAAQSCPICGKPVEFKSVAAHRGWRIDCAPCGPYEITASAWPAMEAATARERTAALTWAKAYNERHANLLGRPCITSVCFDEVGEIRRRRI
jgi:hypothetical protein